MKPPRILGSPQPGGVLGINLPGSKDQSSHLTSPRLGRPENVVPQTHLTTPRIKTHPTDSTPVIVDPKPNGTKPL